MTLPELLIAAAIGILMAAALFSGAGGEKPLAARAAFNAVDAALSYARTLAATGSNGATVVFAPQGNGFRLEVYRGRPNATGALTLAMPPQSFEADVREATLGAPPFTVFFDGAGHAGATGGEIGAGSVLSSDPGCPAGRSITLVFGDPRARLSRTLPCRPA